MVGCVSKQVYIPERKTLLWIERSFADLLQDLEQQEGAARSSLLKLFVSVVASIREDKSFKRLELKGAKHIVSSISEEEFCKHTIWGRTSIDEYLDKELEKALGSCRLGLDMFISRIPNGTPIDSFGSLTLAPRNFSECQEQDLTEKFDTRDFVFPSSLFLLGHLDDGQKKAALPVFMLSSSFDLFGRGANDSFLSRDSVNINLILEDCCTGHINIDGEDWLKGSVQIGKKSFLLTELYKKILHSYKFWTGYKEASVDERESRKIFGLLFIPSGNDYRSRTALLCPVQLHFESEDASCFVAKVAELVENISILVKLLGGLLEKYLAHAVEGLVNERLVLANTQSAISAIMSRNGSHNIGSHVLSALSHNVGTMPDDRVLYQYIQHRMDYIATATTGFPEWGVPTLFVGEIMRNFLMQHHLLDHIVESEGLHAYHFQGHNAHTEKNEKDALCIRIVSRASDNTECPFVWYPEDGKPSVSALRDVQVAIPGGVAGHHAIYTILENVIRNAAKHGWAREAQSRPKNLEITVRFSEESDKNRILFTVFDNIEKGANNLGELVKSLNAKLSEKLISDDEGGGLRQENWGLAEMRISAAYLQRRTLGETGGLEELPDGDFIIKAIPVESKYLGYEFHVPKPKEMLFVLPSCSTKENALTEKASKDSNQSEPTWDKVCQSIVNSSAIIKKFEDHGIYLALEKEDGYYEIVNQTERPIQNMHYEYVILPKLPSDFKVGKYPFRVLTLAKSQNDDCVWDPQIFSKAPISNKVVPSLWGVQDKIKKWMDEIVSSKDIDTENVNEIIQNLKNCIRIYWLWYLEKRTRGSANGLRRISILVDTKGVSDNNAGQGLISDYDVCKYIFEHVWSTILEEIVREKVPGGSYLKKWMDKKNLSVVEYFDRSQINKSGCDSQNMLPEARKDIFEHAVGYILEELEGDINNSISTEGDKPTKEVIEKLKLEELEGDINNSISTEGDKPLKENIEKLKKRIKENIEKLKTKLVDHLVGAYPATHALLRKYAELIDTLPEGFCMTQKSNREEPQNQQNAQVYCKEKLLVDSIGGVGEMYLRRGDVSDEFKDLVRKPNITYSRHGDQLKNRIYRSGLSGSQSSFSQFQHLEYCDDKETHLSMFAQLVENALMRVLIVDERVSNFLSARPRVAEKLKDMHIEYAKTNIDWNKFNCYSGWKEKNYIVSLLCHKYDVLIIHQGIIDKMLGDSCSLGNVENFLNKVKEIIPYAVITTGRGRPTNTPASARILPFPCIERYLFKEWPEKFLLINSVMNLLPCGEIKSNG